MSQTNAYIGVHSLSKDKNSDNKYDVSSFIIHPSYDGLTFNSDIALVRLKLPVTPSERVNFICVEKNVIISENDSFVLVGWGDTLVENKKIPSDVLLQVSIPNLQVQQCIFKYDPIKQICAGDPTNSLSSCRFKLNIIRS